MFIVTRGAGNYKMGGVQVSAVNREAFSEAIARRKTELDRLTTDLLRKENECENTGFSHLENLRYELCRLDVAKLRLGISEGYLAAIPKDAVTAITDSDGKYQLTLPSSGQYIIAAKASRDAGRTTEAYLWVVPLDAIGGEQKLSLSSSNLWRPGQTGY